MSNRARGGVTLVEIVIAMAILAVALMALISALTASDSLRGSTREQAIAYNAVRDKLEEMRNSGTFSSIFADYSVGGARGNTFRVPHPDHTFSGSGTECAVCFKPPAEHPTSSGANPSNTALDVLQPVSGQTAVGFIDFPINGSGNLDETLAVIGAVDTDADRMYQAMGMPRDLTGDGDATDPPPPGTDTSVNTTYKLLPVRIVMRWQSGAGEARTEMTFLMTDK